MEICFENKSAEIYTEKCCQCRRIQESVECVVPDVNEDIGSLASVQPEVYLKSKDASGRGVCITGEVSATVLYITENENCVSFVKMSKPFSIEFETDGIEEPLAHIRLKIANYEARILNPRKLSVTFEIEAELIAYERTVVNICSAIPENNSLALHIKNQTVSAPVVNTVCEKQFTFSEQYTFTGGKPLPQSLISQKAEFSVSEIQPIGSKAIVKGTFMLKLCYASDEAQHPVRAEFSSAFSQLIDIGSQSVEQLAADIELSSTYYELIDTISGDKAVDVEIHAVLQLIGACRLEIAYIADAYSNLFSVQSCTEPCRIMGLEAVSVMRLSADEKLTLAEECSDVLDVFASLSQITADEEKITVGVNLDIIYCDDSGRMHASKRSITAKGDCPCRNMRINGARLSDVYIRPSGSVMDVHISTEISCLSISTTEYVAVSGIESAEECSCDYASLPSLTLVRAERESVWELAKKYHSNEEIIKSYNETEGDLSGKMLLIPKCQ